MSSTVYISLRSSCTSTDSQTKGKAVCHLFFDSFLRAYLPAFSHGVGFIPPSSFHSILLCLASFVVHSAHLPSYHTSSCSVSYGELLTLRGRCSPKLPSPFRSLPLAPTPRPFAMCCLLVPCHSQSPCAGLKPWYSNHPFSGCHWLKRRAVHSCGCASKYGWFCCCGVVGANSLSHWLLSPLLSEQVTGKVST